MGISQSLDLSLPTEPLMLVVLLITIVHQACFGFLEKKLLRHPISVLIIAMLGWALICTVASTMPLVSIKNFIARLWFIAFGFVAAHLLFKKDKENMHSLVWLIIIPLSVVILYALPRHYWLDFSEDAADWIASPFYKDHTVYGACIAITFPVLLGFLFQKRYQGTMRLFILLLIALHTAALIYSYTRAAWISIVAALFFFLIVLMKIRFKTICILAVVSAVAFLCFQNEILLKLSRNKQDSEANNLSQNVQSVSNISTDVSNLERINRWNCAIRMFKEKPVFGFGPGTYMFNYAPYQIRKDKTVISTDFATGGNAHSEYLGPLCEQGLIGGLLMVALLIAVVYYGLYLVYTIQQQDDKIFIGSVFLGLITYFTHGFLNNYLDTDKAAVPFWAFIAILVNYDLLVLKAVDKKTRIVPEGEQALINHKSNDPAYGND